MSSTLGPNDAVPLLADLCLFLTDHAAFPQARTVLEGVTVLRPDHATTRLLRGMLFFGEEQYAKAEEEYRGILQTRGDDNLAQVFLAESLIAQRRWREAEQLLNVVTAKGSDEPAIRFAEQLAEGLRAGLFQRGG